MALAERLPFQGGGVGATRIGGGREGIEAVLDLLARFRPAWHALAACRARKELSWFPGANDDAGAAVAVCGGCAVAVQCRQAAEANGETHGIWAGEERGRRAKAAAVVEAEDRRIGAYRACRRDGFGCATATASPVAAPGSGPVDLRARPGRRSTGRGPPASSSSQKIAPPACADTA